MLARSSNERADDAEGGRDKGPGGPAPAERHSGRPSLTWADAYATTAFVMGSDGLAWVADHTGYGALAIIADDRVIWTPVVEDLLDR